MIAFAALLLAVTEVRAQHAPDAVIDPAIAVDLTPDGLAQLGGIAGGMIPLDLPIDDMSESSGSCPFNYGYSLTGAAADVELTGVGLVPRSGASPKDPGYLEVTVGLTVAMNSEALPFELGYELICLDDECDGWVDPFPITLSDVRIYMEVVDDGNGGRLLDATIVGLDEATVEDHVSIDLSNDDIHLESCGIGDIEEVLNWFGLSLYDLILDLAMPEVIGSLGDLGPELETTIEDAFNGLVIEQELDLNGSVADLTIHPSDVAITDAGVRLALDGHLEAQTVNDCIAEWDPGFSLETASNTPDLGVAPSGVASDFHAAAHVSDDFANQALYALWRGGLLCMKVDEETFALDTSLLSVLAQESFAQLFPVSVPAFIEMHPKKAPTIDLASTHDVGLAIEDLGIAFYAAVDAREALLFEVEVDIVAGMDLDLDPNTGAMSLGIDMGTGNLVATVSENELMPEATEEIQQNFVGLFTTLGSGLLGGLLEGLTFDLPSIEGFGVMDLVAETEGAQSDWLGLFAWVGPVSYPGTGCSGDKKTEGGAADCAGGCASGGNLTLRWVPLMLPLALLVHRRRRI